MSIGKAEMRALTHFSVRLNRTPQLTTTFNETKAGEVGEMYWRDETVHLIGEMTLEFDNVSSLPEFTIFCG